MAAPVKVTVGFKNQSSGNARIYDETGKFWYELQVGEKWEVGTFVGDTWVVKLHNGKERRFTAPATNHLWEIKD